MSVCTHQDSLVLWCSWCSVTLVQQTGATVRVDVSVQGCSIVYTEYTGLYRNVHCMYSIQCTAVYRSVHCTPYKSVQEGRRVYKSVQECTGVYSQK